MKPEGAALKTGAAERKEPPTVLKAVLLSEKYLAGFDVESPRLDAERLLAKALDCTRMDLYLNFDKVLDEDVLASYREYLSKRAKRYPLQYIIGETEFFSLPFKVREGVFIPRPETELLVERAAEAFNGERAVRFLEFGVGSGVISGALTASRANWKGIAFDVSPGAVSLARENFRTLGVEGRITSFVASGFDALRKAPDFDIIVSNPPYIIRGEIDGLQREVSAFEDRAALDGGEDGYRFYPILSEAGTCFLRPGGLIAVEVGAGMGERVKSIFARDGYSDIECSEDYNGFQRVVTARRI